MSDKKLSTEPYRNQGSRHSGSNSLDSPARVRTADNGGNNKQDKQLRPSNQAPARNTGDRTPSDGFPRSEPPSRSSPLNENRDYNILSKKPDSPKGPPVTPDRPSRNTNLSTEDRGLKTVPPVKDPAHLTHRPLQPAEPFNSSKLLSIENGGTGPTQRAVLVSQLKQTMTAATKLFCYSIDISDDKSQDRNRRISAVNAFVCSIAAIAKSYILTDSEKYLVSTSIIKAAVTSASASREIAGKESPTVKLTLVAEIAWSNVLQFFHSAILPSDSTLKGGKEAVLSIPMVLLKQYELSRSTNKSKHQCSTALEIHAKGSDRLGSQSGERRLDTVIADFFDKNGKNFRGLEAYLKDRRVRILGNQDKSNRPSRERNITGLARPDDANGVNEKKRPQVAKYGAGSKEVRFNFDAKSYNRRRAKLGKGKAQSGERTVAQYFGEIKGQKVQIRGYQW